MEDYDILDSDIRLDQKELEPSQIQSEKKTEMKKSTPPPRPQPVYHRVQKGQSGMFGSVHVMSHPRPQIPTAPPVLANCSQCTFQQMVPANLQEFLCCQCHTNNKIKPIMGFFKCTFCKQQIPYQYGTAQQMACSLCCTVNSVMKFPGGKGQKGGQELLKKEMKEDPLDKLLECDDMTTAKNESENLSEF